MRKKKENMTIMLKASVSWGRTLEDDPNATLITTNKTASIPATINAIIPDFS